VSEGKFKPEDLSLDHPLTWIRDGDDAGSSEVAVPVIPPHLLIIGIVRKRSMRDDRVRIKASASCLNCPAIRTPFTAGEVQRVRHVFVRRAWLRHAPCLARITTLHGRRIGVWSGGNG
jgi:hypothetical protein